MKQKSGRRGRNLTLREKQYLTRRGIDCFFWLMLHDLPEEMVLKHKMTGDIKRIWKDEES